MTLFDTPEEWGIQSPLNVETTAIATVYRVQSAWGDAALKLFHDGDPKNEADAPIWLRHMADFGAVDVLAETPQALLLRWLEGPTLGDLSRAGEDDAATEVLGQVANRLLHAPPLPKAPFPMLSDWVAPMLTMTTPTGSTEVQKRQITVAKNTARYLLASTPPPRLLHGDLHHDNILRCGGEWCVIDPKGVIGDPAYEVANAFPNPVGYKDTADPIRIARMRCQFSRQLSQPESRIHGWAVVKSALSLLWNAGNSTAQAEDLRMLDAILQSAPRSLDNY